MRSIFISHSNSVVPWRSSNTLRSSPRLRESLICAQTSRNFGGPSEVDFCLTSSTDVDGGAGLDDALAKDVRAAMAKARAFLLTQQSEKCGFGDEANKIPANVSYSAMAANAVIAATPKTAVGDDEAILKAR